MVVLGSRGKIAARIVQQLLSQGYGVTAGGLERGSLLLGSEGSPIAGRRSSVATDSKILLSSSSRCG